MTSARDLVELVRAPAALTVPGDSLAGAAVAGWPFGARTPLLGTAACCLYWAGMALNDLADREVDRYERPERPIPSGRVSPRLALGVATGLTAAGLGLAGLAGGTRAVAVAAPLAAAVWSYDLLLKSTPAGPAAMAACRGLDVLLGAGGGVEPLRRAAPAALAVATHTLAVTAVSRGEVTGGSRRVVGAALAGTAAAAVGAGAVGSGPAPAAGRRPPRRGYRAGGPGQPRAPRLAAAALLAGYAVTVGRAQVAALRRPGPAELRRAVGAGILGTMPLQAAIAAGAGALRAAVPVAAGFPLARWLARRVSPT